MAFKQGYVNNTWRHGSDGSYLEIDENGNLYLHPIGPGPSLIGIDADDMVVTVALGSLDHNDLGGLQGGNGVDEYYHLDAADYAALTDVNAQLADLHTDGSPTFAGLDLTADLDMNANDITNVGLVDGVDVSAHAGRHESGGADEIDVDGLAGELADAQPVAVSKNSGATVGTRATLNFIEGANITLTIADDPAGDEVDITIASAGGVAAHTILGPSHSDAAADAVTQGSLIVGNATPEWDELTIGMATSVLVSNGTDPSWSPIPTLTGLNINNITASRLLYGDAGKAVVSVADLTDWIAGTANQIVVVDDGDGTVTLSTPQDIAAASSPSFAGLGLTGNLDMGANDITNVGMVDGVDVSSHAARHENGGADEIDVTGLSGVLADAQTPVAHAMLSAYHSDAAVDAVSIGSLIYGNATPEWDELVIGAANTVLMSNGNWPEWSADLVLDTLTMNNNITMSGNDFDLEDGDTDFKMKDNIDNALRMMEGANEYMVFVTLNGSERVEVGQNLLVGANYISYDGADEGLGFDSDNNAIFSERVLIGSIAPLDWDVSYEAVLQSGDYNALASNGVDMSLVGNAYYDDTDNRWEYASANFATRIHSDVTSAKILFELAGVGSGAGDAISWLEFIDLTIVNGGTGSITLNGDEANIDTDIHGDTLLVARVDAGEDALYLGDDADDTNKYARLRSQQWDSGGEPEGFTIAYTEAYQVFPGTEYSLLKVGGGDANANAATYIAFYTDSDKDARSGTVRMTIGHNAIVPANSLPIRAGGAAGLILQEDGGKDLTIEDSTGDAVLSDGHFQTAQAVITDTGGTDRQVHGPANLTDWLQLKDSSDTVWYVPATSSVPS